jgi:membrane protease subunit HflK
MGPSGPIRRSGRAASMTLRREGERTATTSQLLESANQSLADALRITFRLLQLAMVVLLALFLLSGFGSVKEGERGIRLLFGRVVESDIEPGFRFSAPYPFGELEKVQIGSVSMSLDESFWPFVTPEQRQRGVEGLTSSRSLEPGRDGSLLTADGAIAHTRWSVIYSRSNATAFAENIWPEDEQLMVRAQVERGIVRAVGATTIDELLKSSDRGNSTLALRAQKVAQDGLDRLGSGIRIEQLTLVEKIPPAYLREKFIAVQSAESQASRSVAEARTTRSTRLAAVAGAASDEILAAIDGYEAAIERGDGNAELEEQLAAIDALMEGREGASAASGEVARLLNDAHLYSTAQVEDAQRRLAVFRAKLEQFKANPRVVIETTWADALREFLSRDYVQTMLASSDQEVEIIVNQDPDIVRALDREQKRKEADEAQARTQEERRRQSNRVQTGLNLQSRGN